MRCIASGTGIILALSDQVLIINGPHTNLNVLLALLIIRGHIVGNVKIAHKSRSRIPCCLVTSNASEKWQVASGRRIPNEVSRNIVLSKIFVAIRNAVCVSEQVESQVPL